MNLLLNDSGKPVFAGYLIKGIDETRCPQEYKLNAEEEGNSYTVYLRLESFETTDIFDLPPNIDSDLRKFWDESFKEFAQRAIQSENNLLFSDAEYQERGDSGVLAIHGTTLENIRADQLDAKRNGWSSCLEKLVYYTNGAMKEEINRWDGAMKEEINRWDRFRANATEIKFQENLQGR